MLWWSGLSWVEGFHEMGSDESGAWEGLGWDEARIWGLAESGALVSWGGVNKLLWHARAT